jgi:hypothetical protein
MSALPPKANIAECDISAERPVMRRPTFGLRRRSQLLSQINVVRLK